MVIMMGVAKKKPDLHIKKPEVIEQNQDGLEYSSEDEKKKNSGDIKGTLLGFIFFVAQLRNH